MSGRVGARTPGAAAGGGGGSVASVAGKTGSVTLVAADVGGVPVPMSQVIPMYIYPSFAGSDWDTAIGNPDGMLIANPSTGPGASSNSDYVTKIDQARAAGMRVLGYVSLEGGTGPGTRAQGLVTADVDAWHTFYPNIDGIFFDVAPTGGNGDKTAYFAAVCAYARAAKPGQVVVVNPGTHPLSDAYVDPADVVCVWEGDYTTNSYLSATVPGYAAAYYGTHPSTKYLHLVYGVADAATMQSALTHAQSMGVRWFYCQTDSLWQDLPTFYDQQVTALHSTSADVDVLDRRAQTGPVRAADVTGLGGAALLAVGTGSGTVAAGNDSRITGAAQKASNLSDLANASTARTNLGLGGAATLAVGTTAGTVAAGDDSRVTGAAQKASNLSDLTNAGTARTNLGLGGAAVLAVGATAGTVAAGDDSRITGAVQPSTVDAKGDLLAGTADNTIARLAVGTNGFSLVADSTQTTGLTWAQRTADIQTLTTPGANTYTVPAGAKLICYDLIQAGGGGGSGRRGAAGSVRCGGGSGAGGARTVGCIPAPAGGTTITVTVGAGGAGGAAVTVNDTNGAAGTGGGLTSFGSYARAGATSAGGGGGGTNAAGTAGSSTSGTTSGGNGAAASGTGGAGVGPSSAVAAGSGGGSGGGITSADVAGAGGSGGTCSNGGAGSAGAVDAASPAAPAAQPNGPSGGGGGGAASITTAAQAGANGATYGGGGGGGGASLNGNNSGKGGDGANGYAQLVAYF